MRDDAIAVRLDLEGFRVIETIEDDDAVTAVVETAVPAGLCRRCGAATLASKGRKERQLRDLPVKGKPLWLRWRRRCFRCDVCGHRFVEHHESIPKGVQATPRFERYLYDRSRPGLIPLSQLARTERVSFYRAQRAHTRGTAGDLDGAVAVPTRLAVDEASFKRGQDYNTVISAPELGRPIELVRGRDGVGFAVWAGMLDEEFRNQIRAVTVDLWVPFHQVIRAAFPGAAIVADKFHVIRHAILALDRVRRMRQRESRRDWRGRLFKSRFLLLRNRETLTDEQAARLKALLVDEGRLRTAWGLKEDLRAIYRINDPAWARRRLRDWCRRAQESGLEPFADVARMIGRFEEEICNYFEHRITNAYAEGVTNKIKCIKRIGFGYRNFDRFRERVLVACL